MSPAAHINNTAIRASSYSYPMKRNTIICTVTSPYTPSRSGSSVIRITYDPASSSSVCDNKSVLSAPWVNITFESFSSVKVKLLFLDNAETENEYIPSRSSSSGIEVSPFDSLVLNVPLKLQTVVIEE